MQLILSVSLLKFDHIQLQQMEQDKLQRILNSQLAEIFDSVNLIQQSAVTLFRDLHQSPEIGLEEYATSAKIRQFLTNLQGLQILAPLPDLPTAVIATLSVSNSTESILLRCELDALPLKQASGLTFSSNNGLHHACGHDGHMTILLIAAKIIVAHRQKLRKNVTFCFQPGEEGKRGAYKLFTHFPSLLNNIEHCYAIHTDNSMTVGQIKLTNGPVTALSNRFTIIIKGRSAHCMIPHSGVDANYIGCSLVSQLYSLSSMTVPTLEGSTLVVYKAEGGSNFATVSDNFKIMASVRTFSTKSYEILKERIIKLSQKWCESFGAHADVQFSELCYRPVVNDDGLVKVLRKKLQNVRQFQILDGQRSFAGQDFCEFSEKKPSCYMRIGSAVANSIDEIGQSKYPLHSPFHRMNQEALQIGIKLWLAVVFG